MSIGACWDGHMPIKGTTKARVPTNLKVLKGSYNSTLANKNEPPVSPKMPKTPDHLSAKQRWAWNRFAKMLDPMRIVTLEDSGALELLSIAYANYVIACDRCRNDSDFTYETRNTYGVLRRVKPSFTVMVDASNQLLNLLGRFGLTPADRPRVSVIKSGQGNRDPEDEFGA